MPACVTLRLFMAQKINVHGHTHSVSPSIKCQVSDFVSFLTFFNLHSLLPLIYVENLLMISQC